MDIITSFCFAESLNSLDYKGFRHLVLVGVKVALPMYWVFKHFRPVQWIFMHTPTWLSLLTSPETAGIMGVQNVTSVLTNIRLYESVDIYHSLFQTILIDSLPIQKVQPLLIMSFTIDFLILKTKGPGSHCQLVMVFSMRLWRC